jgi:beta-mannosidase
MVCSKTFDLTPEAQRNTVFLCELYDDKNMISRSLATFVPNKHLMLTNPRIKVELRQMESKVDIILKAQNLARFVELKVNNQDVIFSDNYFDLPAGIPVKITCKIPKGLSLAQFQEALTVKSLYDSF